MMILDIRIKVPAIRSIAIINDSHQNKWSPNAKRANTRIARTVDIRILYIIEYQPFYLD